MQVDWTFTLLVLDHFYILVYEVITVVCFCSISVATYGDQVFTSTYQARAAEVVSGQYLWREDCET